MVSFGRVPASRPATGLLPADAARLHLDAELEYLRVALNVGARRLERVGLLPGRQSAAVADPFMRAPPSDPAETDAVSDAADRRDALVAHLSRDGDAPPLMTLAQRLELDEDDRLLMTVALASEIAADFRAIFALFDPRGREVPTLASVLSALVPPPRWFAVRSRLDPDHALARYGLIVREEGLETPPGLHDSIRPSLRLLRIARGDTGLDPTMLAYAQLFARVDEADAPLPIILQAADAGQFAHMRDVVDFSRATPDAMPLLVLRGAGGAGRARWTREIARHLGKATLVVDLHAAAMDARGTSERPPLAVALAAALREARIHDAVLALRNYERFAEPQPMGGGEEDESSVPTRAPTHHLSLRLEQCLAGHPNPVALLVPTDFADFPELRRGLEIVDLAMPDPATLQSLWERHFPADKLTAGVTFDALVAAFRLTPGELESAAKEGVRALALSRKPEASADMAMLQEIVKSQRRHRLRDIATLVTRGYHWNDLIAPATVFAQLRELLSRYRHRHRVMEVWGMKRRFGEAQGISALFEGPPGTGKTMAANIVARELGLDLFQVDLSKVMSKYIGETEKHLATLFDEAERAQALILFDEADSLFAKRTEVKDSHDRHANLKVNYLLQRIERFSGIAVLTTNLPENFDEAFGRRVTVKVHFPKPGIEARKLLWTSMLTGLPTRIDDFDLNEVSREFELSGGLIRNSVLRAAFMAAARDIVIDYGLLEIAARIELKHQGKLMRGDPLKDLVENFDNSVRATPNADIENFDSSARTTPNANIENFDSSPTTTPNANIENFDSSPTATPNADIENFDSSARTTPNADIENFDRSAPVTPNADIASDFETA